MLTWNPWHGCQKLSEGCRNCYVYRIDEAHGRDASAVYRTADFDLPVRKDRHGAYKIPSGQTVYTCFSSDFFLDKADCWRGQAWEMIRRRSDVSFFIVTKRIDRFMACIPPDWGMGYENAHICCTAENQRMADYRLPVFLGLPIRRKSIICEPLLGRIDLSSYLSADIESVGAGGESGPGARVCDYAWVLGLRDQCAAKGVAFSFHQTGANFVKDGRAYRISRNQQHAQAKRAGIDLP